MVHPDLLVHHTVPSCVWKCTVWDQRTQLGIFVDHILLEPYMYHVTFRWSADFLCMDKVTRGHRSMVPWSLEWHKNILAIGQNITSVCYLVYFWHLRQCSHKGYLKGGGWKNLQPLCYPCNLSRGCFCVGPSWYLDMLQASMYISSEHNVRKKVAIFNRFEFILPCCDLEMTLLWPWNISHMKPNTNRCHHV